MIVNGKEMNFQAGITVYDLLNKMKIESSHVVVEVDMDIIDKNEYKNKKLSSSSKVEIIRFVGGG
ncbi:MULTISPECIES: sulfur carrier protein ThiS [Clostridium]|uniref:sulfur carrier protein ThiS n=1 Tax=Clostridium TaxID=1485 RepID=UPI00082542BC|nr:MULTISPECIES: sulfur carrier protein ThiS [Clostridium]PJI09100.1 thiamine biosynthesis protein ThiS [Clostridium sp. CT7]